MYQGQFDSIIKKDNGNIIVTFVGDANSNYAVYINEFTSNLINVYSFEYSYTEVAESPLIATDGVNVYMTSNNKRSISKYNSSWVLQWTKDLPYDLIEITCNSGFVFALIRAYI